jgi:hypothetical protein
MRSDGACGGKRSKGSSDIAHIGSRAVARRVSQPATGPVGRAQPETPGRAGALQDCATPRHQNHDVASQPYLRVKAGAPKLRLIRVVQSTPSTAGRAASRVDTAPIAAAPPFEAAMRVGLVP